MSAGRRPLPWWTWLAPLVLAHIGTRVSLISAIAPGVSTIYLPIPLGLVMAWWWGPRVLAGVYLNAMLSAGLWGLPAWQRWPLYAAPETLAVFAGWWLFVRVGEGRCWLPTLNDVARFILLGILPAALINAFLVPGQLVVLGDLQSAEFWPSVWSSGIATALDGLAIAAPLGMLLTPGLETRGWSRSDGAVQASLRGLAHPSRLAAVEIAGMFGAVLLLDRFLPLERYWSAYGVFIIWAALRHGPVVAVLANVWLEFIVMFLPALTRPATLPDFPLQNLQTALVILCLVGLVVGHTISDQGREMAQRLQSDRALAASEEFLRLSQQAGGVGSWEWDVRSDRFKWSDELVRMHGIRPDEFDGSLAAIMGFCHPDDLPRLIGIMTAMKGGAHVETFECRICPRTGGERSVLFTGQIQRDRHLQPERVLGVAIDITERKRAEEALLVLEDRLRQSQKMEAVGRLAGGIAHDFNNLVTVINGYSDLVLQELPAGDRRRLAVEQIHRAGNRSASLTRQLLAFSRQQVLAPRVVDLNEIVRDIERMLRRVIGEDVSLVTSLDSALGLVFADPGQIEQVLMNLAVNARDAMPRGGSLRIATWNERVVRDSDAAAGPHVVLSMIDNGTGMSPEVRSRIFEPFFTTKAPGAGTGLGLSVVHGIVEQSGGVIDVATAPDAGTTFTIRLPFADQQVQPAAPPAMASPVHGNERILIVEDEDAVRSLLCEALELRGYSVMEAASGAQALEMTTRDRDPIDLLITDVVMPDMSGPVVAERFSAFRPGARVLFLSGYTDDAVLRHGVLHDQVNFLQKPFSLEALGRKVREVLGKNAPQAG